MKKILAFILPCIIFLTLSGLREKPAKRIFYIAEDGIRGNSGRYPNVPIGINDIDSVNPLPGDHFLLKRGDSFETELIFNYSGTSQHPIVLGFYGVDENTDNPKLYGSEEITGWTHHAGYIYKANVDTTITQLFLNEERMKVARYPNSGYFPVTTVINSTTFTSDSLSTSIDYTDAVWTGRTNHWALPSKNAISSSNDTIELENSPNFDLGVDEGFFLCDKLEFLDEAGEWYFDESTNTVYVWTPDSLSPVNDTVRGSVYDVGMTILNDYVYINGIDVKQFKTCGIKLSNCNNSKVFNSNIIGCELYGIWTDNGSNITVQNNYVEGANSSGIKTNADYSLISDNEVRNSALFDKLGIRGVDDPNSGWGISVGGSNNRIRHNRIINCGDDGISFSGASNMFEYNFIDSTSLIKDDGGGIYGWGTGENATTGTVIRNNIIINIVSTLDGLPSGTGLQGFGTYCDDDNNEWIFENNSFFNISASAVTFSGSDHAVRNNTMLGSFEGLYSTRDYKLRCSYTGNIVASNTYWSPMIRERYIDLNTFSFTYDYNHYVSPYRTTDIFTRGTNWSADVQYDFDEWKTASKQDSHSTINTTALGGGETQRLVYNDTKTTKTFYLNDATNVKDVYNNTVTISFTLQPFTSIILTGTDLDLISE